MNIRKRDGKIAPFRPEKITDAVLKALKSVGLDSRSVAEKVTADVLSTIKDNDTPTVEKIQDAVEFALMGRGMKEAAKSFILYRDAHTRARKELKVRRARAGKQQSITDQTLLLVQSMTSSDVTEWDRNKVAARLVSSLQMDETQATDIAKEVEDRLIATGLKTIGSSLVRELVNSILVDHGYAGQLQDLAMYKVPRDFIESLLSSKSTENSNIVSNNPEAVSLAISELVLKQWGLDAIFSDDVKDAHNHGSIYIHDLGYPTRVYCSSHSIEYIKKYGLKGLNNLNTTSKPAKSASVLTGHLNTYLASMQANYAGALGIAYINVLYAPYLVGMNDAELHQVAQELIFNGSQNAFSRGGQSLHPTELIWVKEDGKYRQVEIGAFADSLIDSHPEHTVINADYEVYKTDACDLKAISFTRDEGKVEDRKIMYVARMPHRGKMYRIHTSNGIVNVTGDHSLFEFKGAGNVVPTKARNLKVNDYVVVPHKVSLTTVDAIYITDFLDPGMLSVNGADGVLDAIRSAGDSASAVLADNGESRYIMKDAKKSDKVRATLAAKFVDLSEANLSLKGDSQAVLCNKLKLTKELGYVAGMYCAEGYNVHKTVAITNMNEALLGKVASALDAMGYPHYSIKKPQRNDDGSQKVCGSVVLNGILGLFLQKTCSEHGIKVLPGWIVDACDECVDGFLDGFHDGEGANRKDPKQQNWSVSNTSRKLISGVSLLMLRKGRETLVFESASRNPSWKPVYELRESPRRRVNPFTAQVTETSFNRYRKHINGQVRKDVEWLMASDLSLTRIKKIEEYEYDGPVYDISVPGTEAFLGGIGSVFFKNTLFLDFNIHTGVPAYLKNVPAIGPGGKYMFRLADTVLGNSWVHLDEEVIDGDWCLVYNYVNIDTERIHEVVVREHDGKQVFTDSKYGRVLTYGDYDTEAKRFCSALLDVWKEGDAYGHVFEFPKCDFHVSKESFLDPEQHMLFQKACEVASHNGSTYFVFDRDDVTLSACCRLRTTIDDKSVLLHPERLRFCGFQNVTINIPQCAYRAKRAGKANLEGVLEELDRMMSLAVNAHLQKKAAIAKMMDRPGTPLWQIGKPANDGRPYVNLEECTYIIGVIGVNDAVKFLTGKEMHKSDDAMDMALHIAAHMYETAKEYTRELGLKFNIEETPAESAARKLAKTDLMYYRDEALATFKGASEDVAYYTNSIHLAAEAPVCLVDRIRKQSMFHSAIESGAIIHAFIGEEKPSASVIENLVRQTFSTTQAAQLTFSPEFTYCMECGAQQRGLHDTCAQCGSKYVVNETRVVGYFSKIQSWNQSKRYGELVARHAGDYMVERADVAGEVEHA